MGSSLQKRKQDYSESDRWRAESLKVGNSGPICILAKVLILAALMSKTIEGSQRLSLFAFKSFTRQ